ncbi:MAG: RNA-binding protein [Elusimicrobiota bacterium]|nr:RNA-binding protein [Elusimicrobiota bacterium]
MNIYVGNLAWGMTDDDLKNSFEEFGEVTSAVIIKDKFTGRSRGFGFVEMSSEEAGEKAVAALNGKDLKGREVKVNKARPREDR